MILSAQTIARLRPVNPFSERAVAHGMTYGLSAAGYDVRIAEEVTVYPGTFKLASTMERFTMPNNVIGIVHDKSTWARQGLAVQNTVIEPGWEGYLTLELSYHGWDDQLLIKSGSPIAQIVFHFLDEPTIMPYKGKYQNQKEGPQEARFENN